MSPRVIGWSYSAWDCVAFLFSPIVVVASALSGGVLVDNRADQHSVDPGTASATTVVACNRYAWRESTW